MQKREKILLAGVVGIGALFVLGLAADHYLFQPAADLDRLTNARMVELQELQDMQHDATRATQQMQQIARRTYADDADRATAISGERIAALLREAELAPAEFTRTPIAPRRLRGGLEVGWTVRGRGPLERVVDLLYLIAAEPVVHRVDGLSLRSGDAAGHVNVQFRFVTLVVDAVPPPDDRPSAEPRFTLADEARGLYGGIAARDLFRPYVPRPPAEPEPANEPEPAPEPAEPAAPPGPGPETYRVVSLSQWRGEPEVHVYDSNEQQTQRYTPGDELAEGKVVMVDYRSLPLPDNPALRSDSRVIVRIDDVYWAIERGHTLADKYQLENERLPAALRESGRERGGDAVAGAGGDESTDEVR